MAKLPSSILLGVRSAARFQPNNKIYITFSNKHTYKSQRFIIKLDYMKQK